MKAATSSQYPVASFYLPNIRKSSDSWTITAIPPSLQLSITSNWQLAAGN
jgi:hypothetical protein